MFGWSEAPPMFAMPLRLAFKQARRLGGQYAEQIASLVKRSRERSKTFATGYVIEDQMTQLAVAMYDVLIGGLNFLGR